MKSIVAHVFGFFSLVIFTITVASHVFALFPSAAIISNLPIIVFPASIVACSLGGMLVFLAMSIAIDEQGHRIFVSKSRTLREWTMNGLRRDIRSMRHTLVSTPGWARAVLAASIVYALMNVTILKGQEQRQLAIYDGGAYLVIQDDPVPISWDEYKRIHLEDSRGLSGFFILFSLSPTIYFLIVRPRLQSSDLGSFIPSPDTAGHP